MIKEKIKIICEERVEFDQMVSLVKLLTGLSPKIEYKDFFIFFTEDGKRRIEVSMVSNCTKTGRGHALFYFGERESDKFHEVINPMAKLLLKQEGD